MRAKLSGALRAGLGAAASHLRSRQPSSTELYEAYRRSPVEPRTVLFESYLGARVSCSPYAIFKAMLADQRFSGFTYVWALDEQDPANRVYAALKSLPGVEFHARNSPGYLRHLATAKYLVSNKTFYQYFSKRPEQVYLGTWHGTTLKTLGKDQYGSMGQYHNVARNILQTDFLVMPNRFTAEILLDSCDVRSLFPGVVVDAGQPRSDLTLAADPAAIKRALVELLGIDPRKEVVLYAPTWRGEVGGSRDISDRLARNIEELSAGLPDRFQLLLKVHDKTYAFTRDNPALAHIANVPDWFETNELLAGVDVLITDYSSIFFDFLCLKRPIIHYVFDRAEYERTRGLYFDMETEMAGPLCESADEVIGALQRIDEVAEEYRDRHRRLLERFAYNEDGHASERVLDIMLGDGDAAYTYRTQDTSKRRVAVRLGTLGPARVAAIEALSALDLDALDIVVLVDGPPGKRDEYYLKKLDARIKVLYRVTASKRWDALADATDAIMSGDADETVLTTAREAARAWREESLGDVAFDAAADLSGEISPWALMFALTAFKQRIFVMPPAPDVDDAALAWLSGNYDSLACATPVDLATYSERLGPAAAGRVVVWEPRVSVDGFSAGLRHDVAHLVAGIEYCVECAAAGLDPFCEPADLLFEFQAGGLEPVDVGGDRTLAAAVARVVDAFESVSAVSPDPTSQGSSAVDLAALLVAERSGS